MRILGISSDLWLSSAALVQDGRVIAASTEERFDRKKMSTAFPVRAIEFCLQKAGISMGDIDCVAMSWNPGIHLASASRRFLEPIRWRGEYLYSIPSFILNRFPSPEVRCIEEKLYLKDKAISIFFIDHHKAHAANAFLLSPFKEAAILSIDGRGENETCVSAKGSGNTIETIQSISMPHSLGLFYGTLTEYLGFKADSDEWKVMALASYGKRSNPCYKKMKGIIKHDKSGGFELDLSYFSYYLFDKQPRMFTPKLIGLLGPARMKDAGIEDRHIQIAAALQQLFEETVIDLLQGLHKRTRCGNVVLGGGCAMNSVLNGKIHSLSPFRNVFISSCPDDSGNSVGAALYAYNCILKRANRYPCVDNFWGPDFSDNEIKDVLDKYKLKYSFHKDIPVTVARLLSRGKLVGWFQGRMEFGQRALGNRSILADPRNSRSKELVNRAVKYRESFRPFAPAVLEEDAHAYFDIPRGAAVPFMEKVYKVREEKRKSIPAVVHVDGTGRLQTVSRKTNPLFYSVISEFKSITGIPVVLNTSFNLNGEPIVCSPTDAIRTFISCGLDCLAMGRYLIEKE
ncbi:MAG: carbamoyltransferase C-terminal domain-containing protein [Candidatus Omnitrophica bacterium]|nr:carbamoyltransferase C-terminal domain-containing protein [Candidatus Omnitrophota bacterium]